MPMQVKGSEDQQRKQVAWSIAEWCKDVKIGRATFYRLAGPQKPRTASIRGRQIVVEAPGEYLARIAGEQEQANAA